MTTPNTCRWRNCPGFYYLYFCRDFVQGVGLNSAIGTRTKLRRRLALSTSIALLMLEITSNAMRSIFKSNWMACVLQNRMDMATNSRIVFNWFNQIFTQVQHMLAWHVINGHSATENRFDAYMRVGKIYKCFDKTKGACVKWLSLHIQCLQPWNIWTIDVSCKTVKYAYRIYITITKPSRFW